MRRVILMCAFLKMFVIYVVSAEVREGGPYMCGFFWFLAGGCGRLSRGGMCVCVYREPIVLHDVVDGVQFFFIFVLLQAVGVQSIV